MPVAVRVNNFFIWIGHADDQRAWRQLREARETFQVTASEVTATARAQAFEELLIAEGSDWFWWYGDDHSSDHDLDFDDLFRRHLRNVLPSYLHGMRGAWLIEGVTQVSIRSCLRALSPADVSRLTFPGIEELVHEERLGELRQRLRSVVMGQ